MDPIHIVVLGIVQGVSEFLPISSAAHLILVPQIMGWPDQGLAVDAATHLGTLAAVIVFFRRDVARMTMGTFRAVRGRLDGDGRLALQILAATVPALIAGVLLKDTIETDWRDPAIICWTTVIFGLLLYAADRVAASRPFGAMNLRHAMIVGVAQAIALLPGVSRSGITMTAGRALGYGREEAARFSFLLSLPVTAAAGLAKAYDLLQSGDAALQADAALAALVSFATALVVIWGLLAWLRRFSFTPFVLYRLALGAALMAWLYL